MSSAVDLEVIYRILNAPLRAFPFPHLYVPDILPPDYYAELQANLPRAELLKPLAEARGTQGYPERFVLALGGPLPEAMSPAQRAFWDGFGRMLLGGRLAHAVLQKFAAEIGEQLRDQPDAEITDESLLVLDRTRYALGPHTDSPRKAASLLFYLPRDARHAAHGTSLYVPRDPDFTCPGDRHHDFADFERVATMPFAPNSLFAFPKTRASFHGVEPILEPGVERYLALYDLRVQPGPGAAAAAGPAAAPGGPSTPPGGPAIRFRM